MRTTVFVHTEFGTAEFTGDTAEKADKLLKSKLRKIGLSIKKLRYLREMQSVFAVDAGALHILYSYEPTAFRYDAQKAAGIVA